MFPFHIQYVSHFNYRVYWVCNCNIDLRLGSRFGRPSLEPFKWLEMWRLGSCQLDMRSQFILLETRNFTAHAHAHTDHVRSRHSTNVDHFPNISATSTDNLKGMVTSNLPDSTSVTIYFLPSKRIQTSNSPPILMPIQCTLLSMFIVEDACRQRFDGWMDATCAYAVAALSSFSPFSLRFCIHPTYAATSS